MNFYRKYGAAVTVEGIPLITISSAAFATNPPLAAGDVTISKDGGAFASIEGGGTFGDYVAVTPAGGRSVRVSLGVSDVDFKQATILFRDQTSPGAWEDQEIRIETFGNASAQFPPDFGDAVRLGLTALPNAAAEASGGLITRGSSAGQLNVASGKAPATIAAGDIAAGAIDATAIADDAIDVGAFADGAISASVLAAGAITNSTFGAGAIDAAAIAANAIGASELGADAVAEIVAAILAGAVTAPTSVPTAPYTVDDILGWLLAIIKFKRDQSSTQERVFQDDGTTLLGTAPKSDNGTTFTRGEYS